MRSRGVAGGGSVRNQVGIWNRHLLKESDNDRTLTKYSPQFAMLKAGMAPNVSAKAFLQAGQNSVPKSLSVAGFFALDRFFSSDLNLCDK